MVKIGFGVAFAAVAVILMGATTTEAEAPIGGGYSRHSYDSNNGGYPSSPGYVYGPPKEAGIPGVAGRDYPNFSEVPPTSFSCDQQPLPGYYADPEAGCQVYHICEKGVREKEAHLCPIGSIFDQEKLTCAWWYEVDCARSASAAIAVNSAVVSAMEEADALAKARKYAGYGRGPSSAYGAPSAEYGAPSGSYAAPLSSYGAPAGGAISGSSYNSRSGAFNALSRAYGAPSRRLGGSFRGIGGRSRAFGSLSRAYGVPSLIGSGFGGAGTGLSRSYGAPSAGLAYSGVPSEEYGVPGGQGGHGGLGGGAYLPPL